MIEVTEHFLNKELKSTSDLVNKKFLIKMHKKTFNYKIYTDVRKSILFLTLDTDYIYAKNNNYFSVEEFCSSYPHNKKTQDEYLDYFEKNSFALNIFDLLDFNQKYPQVRDLHDLKMTLKYNNFIILED